MMRRLFLPVLACAALCVVAFGRPAGATTYQWTTPDGVIGLTDDPGRIPDSYRDNATTYKGTPVPYSVTPDAGGTPAPERADLDLNGHDRAWWREKIREIRAQEADLRAQRRAAEDELNQLHYFGRETPEELQRQTFLTDKIKEFTETMAALEQRLTDELPREARRAGAPPGWLRE